MREFTESLERRSVEALVHSQSVAAAEQTKAADVRLRLAAIVDSSNDAIISKDLDGVISTWNPAAQRLFGYSEAEAVGRRITIIIPSELHDEEQDILRRVHAGERIEHYETRRITRDGRSLDVSLTISPVRDAEGRIVGASKIARDVTETKRTQTALRESERRLAIEVAAARTLQSISTRLISELTQDALVAQILDAAIELMAADASSFQMLAPDGETLKLLGWRNLHADSAAFWQRVTADAGSTCSQALRSNERVVVSDVDSCEFMAGTQDLHEFRRSGIRAVQSTPLQSRDGRPIGMISTHWRTPHTPTGDDFRLFDVLARQAADLIERTRAESALRESEERFRLNSNAAPVIIWMADAAGQCTYLNQTWLDLTGRPLDATLGNGWVDDLHPDDVAQMRETFAKAFDRKEQFHVEYRLRCQNGEYRWIAGTGVPRYDGDGSFAGYIGSANDVTERKLAEGALASINQRLIDAQEEERARIARELHDDINQRLSLLSIRLATLAQDAVSPATEVRCEVEEAREEVLSLSRDMQSLSHRLHPARVEYLGIAAAARALCREISSHRGVDISFRAENIPEGLSNRVAVCLYRVLQEALQNAIKHSGARKVEVSLVGRVDAIELDVHDLGVGFDPKATQSGGLGLTSMKERLTAVRGQLVIRSRPQHGTTIRARVPVLQQ